MLQTNLLSAHGQTGIQTRKVKGQNEENPYS